MACLLRYNELFMKNTNSTLHNLTQFIKYGTRPSTASTKSIKMQFMVRLGLPEVTSTGIQLIRTDRSGVLVMKQCWIGLDPPFHPLLPRKLFQVCVILLKQTLMNYLKKFSKPKLKLLSVSNRWPRLPRCVSCEGSNPRKRGVQHSIWK